MGRKIPGMFTRTHTDAFGAPTSGKFRKTALAAAAAGLVATGGAAAGAETTTSPVATNAQSGFVSIAGLKRIGKACQRLSGFKVCTFATKDPTSTDSNRYRIATSIKVVEAPKHTAHAEYADEKVMGHPRETGKENPSNESLPSEEFVTSRWADCSFTPNPRRVKSKYQITLSDTSDSPADPDVTLPDATLEGTVRSKWFDNSRAGCGVNHQGYGDSRSAALEPATGPALGF